jgi:predicted TPR repeat methyltransferase
MIYLLIFLILIYVFFKYFKKEGFEQKNVFRTCINDIYDEFYTKMYDELIHLVPSDIEMIKIMKPYFVTNSNVLCVGSKTGHIVQLLSESMNVTGVDKSYEMVKMAQYKYPKNRYIYGDYSASFMFQQNAFTIILCPLLTINTVASNFFQNANIWLVHQGYMAIMYFKDEFNIDNVRNHNPSQYFRINYDYSITLEKNRITEKIANKKNQVRTNIQYLNHLNLEQEATDAGFRKLNNVAIPNLPHAYLLIFQKI